MRKQIIFFDYDDTLVDTINSRIPAIISYCESEHHISPSSESIRNVWGMPFDQMMKALGCKEPIDKESYIDSHAVHHPIIPFPESEEVIKTLGKSFSVGILTALARKVLDTDLQSLNWHDGRFTHLYAQEDSTYHKPHPGVFDPVLSDIKKSNLTAADILYIGDRATDAQSALGAGIDFIGIARTENTQETFNDLAVPFVTTLQDVFTHLS